MQVRVLAPLLPKSGPRRGVPDLVVLHWTAGPGEPDALARYLRSTSRQASYHLAIGRDGDVLQLVALDRAAWHAGDGRLDGARVNPISVGIALCNRGPVRASPTRSTPAPTGSAASARPYPTPADRRAGRRPRLAPLGAPVPRADHRPRGRDSRQARPWDDLPLAQLGLSRWLGPWPARSDRAAPPTTNPPPSIETPGPGTRGGPAADRVHARSDP